MSTLQPVATLSPSETDIRRHARARLKRFQTEIENRLSARDLKAARHKVRKMIGNRSVRLQALILANRKAHPSARKSLDQLQGLIDAVRPMSRTASPQGFAIEKSSGGRRPVFKFGLVDQACAILIREALKPFARAHPRWACHPAQVLLSGGLPAACEHLRQALHDAPDGAVFLQIDVKRFFPSVACDGLAAMTGLPPEVVHRHLSVEHVDVRGKRSLERVLSTQENDPMGETAAPSGVGREKGNAALGGIATGSAASSLVAEMVMGHILRDAGCLPGLVALIVYSDNIGAVVRSREEALAVQAAVLGAFSRSRAGPFSASKVSIRDIDAGFSFLGYQWRRQAGSLYAEPIAHHLSHWELRFGNDLLFALSTDDVTAFDRLRSKVRGYAASKTAWADRFAFLARWERLLDRYEEMVATRLAVPSGDRHARPPAGCV